MNKIGIVITDGVGFRNFILSDFLSESEHLFDEVVIFSCLPAFVFEGLSQKAKVIELSVFSEKFPTWFFRKVKEIAHLQLHKKSNFGIQDNLNASYSRSRSIRGFATNAAFRWAQFFHSENWIQAYYKLQQLTFRHNPITKEYLQILENEKVDLLFFTHQRPAFIAPLIYSAGQLKIKTAAFIFSWDNLASKNRMAGNFDYYLVWSSLMKSELQQFYVKIKAEKIEVVGTPQFEPYALDRYKTDREAFFTKFGLDPSKKTICFSCGDITTSKNDELYIETIANAIASKTIADVNLIIRTSPAEDPVRFADLVKRFGFIKWNFPDWNLSREGHQETWSQRVPTIQDVKDLRALIEFSDLNINMLSTMSLDFMQFDKPVINTVFGNDANGLYNDQRFLKYAHIVNVVNSQSTRIVTNETELIDAIKGYLADSALDAENREAFRQLQVGKPLAGTGKRIAEQLKEWTDR